MVQEIVEAAERGELERLQARCRMWDETHPDAPACFGTDAWVPTLWTAAHKAAEGGRTRVLRWLVEERGMPVHRATPEEQRQLTQDNLKVYQTPLTMACTKGARQRRCTCCGRGCSGAASMWTTAAPTRGLLAGARKGISADLMAALVEEGGFDPQRSTLDPDYMTPLTIAAKWGHVHLVDYLLRWARRKGLVSEALA